MRSPSFLGGLALLAIVACGEGNSVANSGDAGSRAARTVVVYAANDHADSWPAIFEDFTRETGIRVSVRYRDAATVVGEVIRDAGSPPADILLTPSVHGAWEAAGEGALRPLRNDVMSSRVADALRDPDDYWIAVRTRIAVVGTATRLPSAPEVTGFADLGDVAFRGHLCLTKSALPLNRVLIASLIDHYGIRDAELIVRRWVSNLALPPFDDESALREAVGAGSCKLAILSTEAAGGLRVARSVVGTSPVVDVEAIGVARHASDPESAERLIAWLLESGPVSSLTSDSLRPIARVAYRIDDAIDLAERAGYR